MTIEGPCETLKRAEIPQKKFRIYLTQNNADYRVTRVEGKYAECVDVPNEETGVALFETWLEDARKGISFVETLKLRGREGEANDPRAG